MTSSCYICSPLSLSLTLNLSLTPDYYLIECLNEMLESSLKFPDISSIIKVTTCYNDYLSNIITIVNKYHTENCFQCTKCNQHVPIQNRHSTPIIPLDVDYGNAVCYFAGLNGSQYSILEKLKNCIPEITAINDMIGMDSIKKEFTRLMKYLSMYDENAKEPLMHMGIYGPPGHGKTQIARLLGKAFSKSGLLSKPDVFISARRADLIGQYCGHTAKNTTEMFNKARGGVIFIDEIYSLGNPEKRDVFTKECIDTINQLLSERTDTLCIIAGYEEDAEASFFAYNKGLARRFPFNFIIKSYTEDELCKIFVKLANDDNWEVEDGAILPSDLKFKKGETNYFDNAGGDMENLLVKSIMAHYDNIFLTCDVKKIISRDDILNGLAAFKLNKKIKSCKFDPPPFGMYT